MKSYIDNGETLSLVNLNTLTVVDIESTRQAGGPDDLTFFKSKNGRVVPSLHLKRSSHTSIETARKQF